jgi:hypothetical protein
LVFSLLPRCQGEWGPQKYTDTGVDADAGMLGHFVALVPGDGATQCSGQFLDRGDHGVADDVGAARRGQMEQPHESGGPQHRRH